MMHTPTYNRAGIALLIVLAALVVSTTAISIMTAAATRHRLTAAVREDRDSVQDLLEASEAPIRSWLTTHSQSTALPSGTAQPVVEVMHDRWTAEDTTYEIRITTWDQLGMIPVAAITHGHPIARALDDNLTDAVSDLTPSWMRSPGLDQFPVELTVFPEMAPTSPTSFDGASVETTLIERFGINGIGSALATHNPPDPSGSRRGQAPLLFNVNTTPIALLQFSMRLEGRGGLEQIRAARVSGEVLSGGALRSLNADAGASGHGVLFVSGSSSWAMRIDVRVGAVSESAWEVWTRSPAGWKVAQRLAIDE